jgi:hypothetical protein
LVEEWITVSFQDRSQIKPRIQDNMHKESKVVQSEKPKRVFKALKTNRKSKKKDTKRRHRKNES